MYERLSENIIFIHINISRKSLTKRYVFFIYTNIYGIKRLTRGILFIQISIKRRTRGYFADSCWMPFVALVTVWTLYENSAFT